MNSKSFQSVLKPISHVATYELVVDQIVKSIFIGRYQTGDKLPSERLMSEQLQVSRATVREAIRVLQTRKIIEVKKGSRGGAFVRNYKFENQLMRNSDPLNDLREIYDLRMAIEPNAAKLAAKRRTREELSELRSLVNKMDAAHVSALNCEPGDDEALIQFSILDTQFHLMIAQASKVPGFYMVVEDIRSNLFSPLGSIYGEMHPNANELHMEIFDAIRLKKAGLAEKIMSQHITKGYKDLCALFHKPK